MSIQDSLPQVRYKKHTLSSYPIGSVVVRPYLNNEDETVKIYDVLNESEGELPNGSEMGHVIGYGLNTHKEIIVKVQMFDEMYQSGDGFKEGVIRLIHPGNLVKVEV